MIIEKNILIRDEFAFVQSCRPQWREGKKSSPFHIKMNSTEQAPLSLWQHSSTLVTRFNIIIIIVRRSFLCFITSDSSSKVLPAVCKQLWQLCVCLQASLTRWLVSSIVWRVIMLWPQSLHWNGLLSLFFGGLSNASFLSLSQLCPIFITENIKHFEKKVHPHSSPESVRKSVAKVRFFKAIILIYSSLCDFDTQKALFLRGDGWERGGERKTFKKWDIYGVWKCLFISSVQKKYYLCWLDCDAPLVYESFRSLDAIQFFSSFERKFE